MVHRVFLVNIAVNMATAPANSLTFPKEREKFPESIKISGTIRADKTAAGTKRKSSFTQEGSSQTPKRNMKNARVR